MSAYGVCVAGGINAAEVPLLQAIGCNWIRGASVDDATFLNSGFNLLGTLAHSHMPTSFTLSQWNSVVTSKVTTRPSIRHWEIWNEPTESTFKLGFTPPDTYRYGSAETASPQGYLNLLKSAYNIIKGIDPTLIVVGFGGMRVMYPTSSDPNKLHGDVTFFQNCVNSGALDYCDAVAIHAFPAYTGDYRVALPAFATNFNKYNQIMSAAGKLKEIWVTEWGCKSPSWIPSGKHLGDALKDIYAAIKPYSTKTFWYKVRDDAYAPDDVNHYGIFDVNDNQKVVGVAPLATVGDYYKTYVGAFTLTVSSSPIAADFTINGVAARTPYTVELGAGTYVLVMPNVLPGNYVFRQWEDGSTNPMRVINLAANSQATAYYEYIPPPPGKGIIDVHARLDGVEVVAPVEITGVGTYGTPFTLELNPANYELGCMILDQTQIKTVTVASEQTVRIDFDFKTAPIPSQSSWTPFAIGAGLILVSI